MAVSIAKFKEIATSAETELVRASRKPAVTTLTAAELKQKVARARKLYDKWLDLSRSQSRAKSKEVGFGEAKANTELKVQAFAEALKSFEAQLATQGSTLAAKVTVPRKTKQSRSAGHRAARAEIREELSTVQESLKEPARKAAKKKAVKKVAAKKATVRKAATDVTSAPESKTAKKKKTTKKTLPAILPTGNPGLELNKGNVRQATTAAKRGRLDRSGLTSRVRGHISARGRRAQGRRDSRG